MMQARKDVNDAGAVLHQLAAALWPICRSITGDGVRQTLALLQRQIDLEVREVASGTAVFDWTVPREWNIRAASITDRRGAPVVDFADNNLHLMSYSIPLHARLPMAELKRHLFTVPEQPEVIPYRTSYYKDDWGFCLSQRQLDGMDEAEYQVDVDSSLQPGALTYGEYFVPGKTREEILFSCHVCHPSLANDNLSGIVVACALARWLTGQQRRYSYRFLFTPGCIGSITWLARNQERLGRIRGGLVLACLGDGGGFTYKKSRRGDSEIDGAVAQALKDRGQAHRVIDFSPYGYDERQFCSPGINLPVGALMRTPHGEFPEYHTSADDLNFLSAASLAGSLDLCREIVELLESNRRWINQNPKCEPQLGKRGLYGAIGGQSGKRRELAHLWVLNYSDGGHSLLDIAARSGMRFDEVADSARALAEAGLLKERRADD